MKKWIEITVVWKSGRSSKMLLNPEGKLHFNTYPALAEEGDIIVAFDVEMVDDELAPHSFEDNPLDWRRP